MRVVGAGGIAGGRSSVDTDTNHSRGFRRTAGQLDSCLCDLGLSPRRGNALVRLLLSRVLATRRSTFLRKLLPSLVRTTHLESLSRATAGGRGTVGTGSITGDCRCNFKINTGITLSKATVSTSSLSVGDSCSHKFGSKCYLNHGIFGDSSLGLLSNICRCRR